ncbi:4-oxalocrotonate tautomerase family protein [Salipiger sp. P9]|uniref:2-hydroxymuconate tautomerase n=1 Tax=Salipiger pentaromativorans TaxID=2943193 RepID=UPI00215772D9|nr:2-hydroxymuconate tautomerase [Salipiger pentaromativorans]MCR8547408.1 4-oxalocrotonate tautomerase family protein [Salipiger pentaromativorans]
MPFIEVTMVEGRTDAQKAALIEKLTDAAVEAVGAPIEAVRVCIREIPRENWGVAGKQKFLDKSG